MARRDDGESGTESGTEQRAKGRMRKLAAPVAAGAGVLGTMASIWWFALRPRRKRESA